MAEGSTLQISTWDNEIQTLCFFIDVCLCVVVLSTLEAVQTCYEFALGHLTKSSQICTTSVHTWW